jgi:hypothetical protein
MSTMDTTSRHEPEVTVLVSYDSRFGAVRVLVQKVVGPGTRGPKVVLSGHAT